LLETAENRGVTLAGSQAWSQAATTRLSSSDIRSLSSGKKVSVGGRADLDSVQLVISGAPADLEFGMQLAHLLLTEPLLEQTAFDRWKTAQLQNLEAVEKNPSQMFGTLIADVVYPDHEVRGKLLTREAVDRLTRERAQAWLIRLIAESPIEVAVVGDIGEDEAESLAARYVGSVAARKRISPTAYEDLRVLERPKGPRSLDRTIRTSTPQGQVMVGFYGPDRKNLADVRAMSLAAQVLTSRMIERVREDKQLAYSISARLTPGGTFPGFGIFRAASPTNPEKIDALSALVSELFDAFAKEGVSEDELATAKRQQANTLDESMKEPSFWLGVLELMTLQGTNLDDVLAMPVAYQAVTAEAVVTAFRRYHTPENTLGVVLRPVEP
jgi:zinc protease